MKIPLINLHPTMDDLREEIIEAVIKVIDSNVTNLENSILMRKREMFENGCLIYRNAELLKVSIYVMF